MGKRDEFGSDPTWDAINKMTEAELRDELARDGIDPDEVIEGMRRMGRVLAAQYADQIERERRMPAAAEKSLFIFPEAVAAGSPAWADSSVATEETTLLDELAKADKKDMFWARVRGWSMRDAGINDGDLVLVNGRLEPKDGDVVLAHIAGQGQVVKRLRARGMSVSLESCHPDFAPIVVEDPSTLRIHGVVVGRAGSL